MNGNWQHTWSNPSYQNRKKNNHYVPLQSDHRESLHLLEDIPNPVFGSLECKLMLLRIQFSPGCWYRMNTSLEHELSTPVYAQFFLHWLLLWESAVKKIIPFKLFTCIQYDIRGSIKIAIKFILTSIKLQNNHDKMDLNKNLPGERQEEKIVFTFLILLLVSFCVSVLKSCRCVRTAVSPQ